MDDLFASDHEVILRGVEVGGDRPKRPRFDPTRRAASARLKAGVGRLTDHLEAHEAQHKPRKKRTPSKRRHFRLAVEAIACNIVAAALTDPERCLVVPRQHDMMFGRYSNEVYGNPYLHALDLMVSPECPLVLFNRGYRKSASQSAPSTITARPELSQFLPLDTAEWPDLCRINDPDEVLILNDVKDHTGKGKRIDYSETPETTKLRRQVARVNKRLRAANIEVVTEAGRWPADPTDCIVRRYFNNNSWHEGGRLFGGFWMNMPRAKRFSSIRLDGMPVVNVDFEQLFPALAYSELKEPLPPGDLYNIAGDGRSRAGWKRLLNAMLFARSDLKNWPRDTSQLFPDGMKLRDACSLMRDHHHPIAHLFGRGVGFKLMYTESQILLHALDRLHAAGITALPLHDAVLVGDGHGEAARTIMRDAAAKAGGLKDARIKIERDVY